VLWDGARRELVGSVIRLMVLLCLHYVIDIMAYCDGGVGVVGIKIGSAVNPVELAACVVRWNTTVVDRRRFLRHSGHAWYVWLVFCLVVNRWQRNVYRRVHIVAKSGH